jgi:hypothetical protein
MNNDKRIILAIAVYAAVITMVLHTLNSEGHQRYITTEQSAQYLEATDGMVPMSSISGVICTELKCPDEEMVCSDPSIDLAKDNENGTSSDEGRAS